ELAPGEPAVKGLARVVEDTVPPLFPVDVFGGRRPEALGVSHRPRVRLAVDALRHLSPPWAPPLSSAGTLSRASQPPPRPPPAPPGRLLTISIENMYFIGRTMTMSEAGS